MNPDKAPDEAKSDPSVPVVKGELRAAQNHVEAVMKRGLFISDLKAGAMTVIGILAGGYAALHAIDGRAQDKVDAGVTSVREVTEEKFKAVEQRIDWLDKQIAETKSVGQATNGTINRMAIRQGVVPVQPKPVPPRDGGQ